MSEEQAARAAEVITFESLLGRAVQTVRREFPYFSHALVACYRFADPSHPTAYATKDWRLGFNPAFLRMLYNKYGIGGAAFLVYHEFAHCMKAHWISGSSRNLERWNAAADIEINQGTFTYLIIPEEGLTPARFGFPEKLPAETYYTMLDAAASKLPSGGLGSDHGTAVSGDSSCSPPRNVDESGLTPTEVRRIIQRTVEEARSSEQRGSLPPWLNRLASELTKQSQIDWRAQLSQLLCAGRTCAGTSAVCWSKAKVRNFDGVDILTPRRKSREMRLTLIVDVSGSMVGAPLEAALAEVLVLLREAGVVNLVWFDTKVTVYPDVKVMPPLPKHGGGTELQPAVMAAADQLQQDVTVLITDGYVSWGEYVDPLGYFIAAITTKDINCPWMEAESMYLPLDTPAG